MLLDLALDLGARRGADVRPHDLAALEQEQRGARGHAELLRDAFSRALADGFTASDEAGLVERLGHDVYVVLGSERNLKITRPGDLALAEFYLAEERAGR